MTEHLARLIAEELGGRAHHTGGNLWVVIFERSDGSIAVLSDRGVGVYADQEAWGDHEAKPWVDFQTDL